MWQELEKILADTPPVWRGSSKLFRNLRERGWVDYIYINPEFKIVSIHILNKIIDQCMPFTFAANL